MLERIEREYPDRAVVTGQHGGGDQLESTEVTKSILTANPDFAGIFGTNEGSAIAVTERGNQYNEYVVLVGLDSGTARKRAIESATMAGAVTQNPIGNGYETVKTAVEAARGKDVPNDIDTGFYLYTVGTMDNPEIATVLYD